MANHAPKPVHTSEDVLPQRILDNLTSAVMVLNHELVVTYLNAAAEILFETSRKSICGQRFDMLFYQEDDNMELELHQTLISGHSFTKREEAIRCSALSKSNGQLTVNYSVSVIQESGKRFLLLEFQALDRLLKISREEALINNQLASKALLRGMAHEVKNPLGGIKGAAQLLAREIGDNDHQEYINVIIDEADRLRSLVDRMLGPRNIPKIESLNIHEVLEHIYHITEVGVGNKIEFIRDYDPSIPDIQIDRDQFIQASLNILGNACEALIESQTRHPKIIIRTRILRQFTIASRRHRMVVRIDFIDNGPGIPDDIRESLFYPMVSGRPQGSGLGLSIAQSIINQFDGIIECESEAGHTCFSIILPLADSHITAREKSTREKS